MITGNIMVPEDEDPAGITIVNITSGLGTLSSETGDFSITVAENDTLRFSAVQYQEFSVVVDEGVMESEELNVFISPAVNELAEVIVRPYDLSGNVEVDVRRIPTEDAPLPDSTAAEIVDPNWDFRPDDKTTPANAAMREEMIFSGRLNGRGLANVFRHIFTSRSTRAVTRTGDPDTREISDIDEEIQQLYDDEFFVEYLDIARDDIYEFIYFAEDNGLTKEMLEEENEMNLILFLVEQSERYKEVKRED